MLVEAYQTRQKELRALMERTDKTSRTNLQARVARLLKENEVLKEDRELLIASHKAMLLSVGEIGGMTAWRRFFLPGRKPGAGFPNYKRSLQLRLRS